MPYRNRLASVGTVCLIAAVASAARAADDPSIRGAERERIRAAMKTFVEERTISNAYLLYDPVEGRVLRLRFDALHDGIVRKGEFFVSCADFVDERNRKIDVDILVRPDGDRMRATQGLVHAVDGRKRPYALE